MYTIRTLNNIAKTGLAKLPEQNFVIDEKAENPEGIILRSFDMHKMELNGKPACRCPCRRRHKQHPH